MPKKGDAAATLPLGPIEMIARSKTEGEGDFTDAMFAQMIGCSTRSLIRWRKAGGQIPWQAADVAAVNLGLHPLLVWNDEWLALDGDYIAAEMAKDAARMLDAVEAG